MAGVIFNWTQTLNAIITSVNFLCVTEAPGTIGEFIEHISRTYAAQQSVTKLFAFITKVATKHGLLFNKLAPQLYVGARFLKKNFPLIRIFSVFFQLFITVDNNQVTLMIFFHLFILVIAGNWRRDFGHNDTPHNGFQHNGYPA